MSRGFIIFLITGIINGVLAQSDRDLRELRDWMTGHFSSQEQAQRDTNFYDIRLSVYPIWKDRSDGYWMYVEQADARLQGVRQMAVGMVHGSIRAGHAPR